MPPIKLAVVGGGPSAFFVASRLLSLLPHATYPKAISKIDVFDRNWAPHGLVRYGVAPDHPEVKNCVHKFDVAAQDPRLRYFGNVNIGQALSAPSYISNVSLNSILSNYSHLLFATGSPVPLVHPVIPPSDQCVPALSFVHWYTDHPSKPQSPALDELDHVTIIGQGNVALDIARMLLCSPEELSKYDVPSAVLDVLSRSAVKHVSIVGRRGPYEAAFTTKELRELLNLPEASMTPIDPVLLDPRSNTKISRQQSRIIQLLQKGSKHAPGTTRKTWSLDFFRSPIGLAPSPSSVGRHATLTLAHTTLDNDGRAVPTSHSSVLPTSLVVSSLGHRSEPTHPYYDPALGHVRNVGGRVLDADGHTLRHVYASGWAAMGARGVLASTMLDAHMVADAIIADSLSESEETTSVTARAIPPTEGPGSVEIMNPNPDPESFPAEISDGLQAGVITTYADWKRIDTEEVKRGERLGKERERMDWAQASAFLQGIRAARN